MTETSWRVSWAERPTEEAALFNPAFCGELIARSIVEYENTRSAAFPLVLSFLVLPLTLHAPTRQRLPGRSDTTLATWTAERAAYIVDIPDRVLMLRPPTRESILFLAQSSAISVSPEGLRKGTRPLKLSAKRTESTTDTEAARRAAGLIGRWFANQHSAAAILLSFGVKP